MLLQHVERHADVVCALAPLQHHVADAHALRQGLVALGDYPVFQDNVLDTLVCGIPAPDPVCRVRAELLLYAVDVGSVVACFFGELSEDAAIELVDIG